MDVDSEIGFFHHGALVMQIIEENTAVGVEEIGETYSSRTSFIKWIPQSVITRIVSW